MNTIIGSAIFVLTPLVFVYSQSNFKSALRLFFSYPYWLFILYYPGVYFFAKNSGNANGLLETLQKKIPGLNDALGKTYLKHTSWN